MIILRKNLPNFLVLGTQKGGTTSLYKLLNNHSRIYLPNCKEVHYFTKNYEKSVTWYASHYKHSNWRQKKGDITPYYLYHPKAAIRIHKLLPYAKLIVLLRNPTERTISHIYHAKRHGFEELGIKEALKAEKGRLEKGGEYSLQKHSYVSRSMYLEQLDRYERVFRKKQILVIKSEDLFEDAKKTINKIQRFIGVKEELSSMILTKENAGRGEAENVDEEIVKDLNRKFETTMQGVQERYGISWN